MNTKRIHRIVFIEPKSEKLHIFSRYVLPRLGNIMLATIMADRGYDARALFLSRKEILARDLEADLVAISTITPTANVAYELADHFRKRGLPVVVGGPHVTFLPEEALEHADYCIQGEGEETFPLFVEALQEAGGGRRDDRLAEVPGLAWKQDARVRINPPAELVKDLDSLPFCDFDLLDTGGRKLGPPYGRAMVPLQTSRGCPYNCTFCSVTCMFGRRYRYRSTENVIAELKRYNPRKHYLFFYDDNFSSNVERAKKLLRRMIELKLGFSWVTQVRSDVAKDGELLDLMKQAGCTVLFIGFESVDPKALKEMKKAQSREEVERAILEIRRRGIYIHGMFVFGFDADTPETMRRTVDFAIDKKIDTSQFMILTPLPGTELFASLARENRIIDYQWDTFDGHHVTFQPTSFSLWELQKAQIMAHARFCAPRRVLERCLRGRFKAFVAGMYANKVMHRWLRWERVYLNKLRSSLSSFGKAIQVKIQPREET
jgi:radical SAM superfamily enzyme YgiQ (UPF0313 family)